MDISWFQHRAALGQTAELAPAPAAWLREGAQPGALGGSSPRDLAPWTPSTFPSSAGKRGAAGDTSQALRNGDGARETGSSHQQTGMRPN